MSPRDWLQNLPAVLQRSVDLWQLTEPGSHLGREIGALESELGVSIAVYDLTRPEAERSEAHRCRRVQPAVLTGRALEQLRAVQATAAEQVALVAYVHPFQPVGGE